MATALAVTSLHPAAMDTLSTPTAVQMPPAPAEAELQQMDAYWRTANYLAAGMNYLQDNPLLQEPLRPEHIKNCLLGDWGSSPGHIGSHCTAETPGSIHEGGKLGYVLSHACGSVFDNPELITLACVGDGEAETGPLATSWHINKFINPIRDGAVLPVLHLNGYKIANPSILSRIPHAELQSLLRGYGWEPLFEEGAEPMAMHRQMAVAMEQAVLAIRAIQQRARSSGEAVRPRWPMVVLHSLKGWTGPAEVDGQKLENFWRSHQVPITGVKTNPEHLRLLEEWLKSYRPWELFDDAGAIRPEIRALAPRGDRRMGSNPHTNGGVLRRKGQLIRDLIRNSPGAYHLFGPDETASNRLKAVFEATNKVWMAELPAGRPQWQRTGP